MYLTLPLKLGIIATAVVKGALLIVIWKEQIGRTVSQNQPIYCKFAFQSGRTRNSWMISSISPHCVLDSMNRDVPSLQKSPNRLVNMNIEDTVHYGIFEPAADMEWAELVPNGGLVEVNNETYTIALFHQLGCLDVVRRALRDRLTYKAGELERHCLNYLRQTLVCRSDIHVEVLGGPLSHTEAIQDTFICNDWESVYNSVN